MFPLAAVGQRNSTGSGPDRQGSHARALGEPRLRPPGDVRRAAGRRPRGGDHDAGRGPGASARHGRGQPLRLNTRRGDARGGDLGARLHGLARHLRQRDDPPCRRHPAGAGAARQGALRLRPLPARDPLGRELLTARDRCPRRPAAGMGDGAAARRDRRRPGPGRRHRGLGRPRRRDVDRTRGRDGRLAGSRAATRPRSSPSSSRAAAPSGCSTSCSAPARSATASAPTPTA